MSYYHPLQFEHSIFQNQMNILCMFMNFMHLLIACPLNQCILATQFATQTRKSANQAGTQSQKHRTPQCYYRTWMPAAYKASYKLCYYFCMGTNSPTLAISITKLRCILLLGMTRPQLQHFGKNKPNLGWPKLRSWQWTKCFNAASPATPLTKR